MSDRDRPAVEVRAVLGDAARRQRVRGLVLAALSCAALVAAVVAVGLAVGWPVWVVVLAVLMPLAVGLFAARAAYAMGRQRAGPGAR
jgi:hypothetical protein